MAVKVAAAALSVAAPAVVFAQGQMQIVPVDAVKWVPCDPNATDTDVCQLAYFRGDPEKEPNYKMLKAKAGFVFHRIGT
jgi:hypothetical protein